MCIYIYIYTYTHTCLNSFQTTGTGTRKHLKSALKNKFLLLSSRSNICRTFPG